MSEFQIKLLDNCQILEEVVVAVNKKGAIKKYLKGVLGYDYQFKKLRQQYIDRLHVEIV